MTCDVDAVHVISLSIRDRRGVWRRLSHPRITEPSLKALRPEHSRLVHLTNHICLTAPSWTPASAIKKCASGMSGSSKVEQGKRQIMMKFLGSSPRKILRLSRKSDKKSIDKFWNDAVPSGHQFMQMYLPTLRKICCQPSADGLVTLKIKANARVDRQFNSSWSRSRKQKGQNGRTRNKRAECTSRWRKRILRRWTDTNTH